MRNALLFVLVAACGPAAAPAHVASSVREPDDTTVRRLVAQLELERYKATIKALTAFGDRRQGTERNRKAIDWIEAQLRAYGCSEVERLDYVFAAAPRPKPRASGSAAGGGTLRGVVTPTGVNTDPERQPDATLRVLDAETSTPGPRQEVFCTKIGRTHPDEMYIVGAHMDGHGYGEAANDDGSGTAIVMELARIFHTPGVTTERSIRFALWNNEETGLDGSRAYVEQRAPLRGKELPPGSGHYPEPRWLGMIQHDMMLFDHGMPRADGTMSAEQRPEADVNIEFQVDSKLAAESAKLAWAFHRANEKFATDYPAQVGNRMTNTDSTPFMDVIPAISLRENERGTQIGAGWDPHWHQPSDVFSTFSDRDFRLGLNAAQTTLAAVAGLTGASL